MAIFKYPNSKIWWYDFRFAGTRIRESTKSASRTLARDAERARRRSLEERFNGVAQRQGPKQFSAAASEYEEAKTGVLSSNALLIIHQCLHLHLLPVIGNKLLTDIEPATIKEYQKKRLQEGAAPATVNLEFAAIRAILRRNRLWENVRYDVRPLQVHNELGYSLTVEDEQTLLNGAQKRRARYLPTLIIATIQTGMRKSEVEQLQWARVDLESRTARVGKSKTLYGTDRVIPLNSSAFEALKLWADRFPDRKPAHYVFPHECYGYSLGRKQTGTYDLDPTRPIGVDNAWRNLKRAEKLEYRFHDLRHTTCARMLEAGVPIAIVARILGWSPSTTVLMIKRYGHISPKACKDAMEAVQSVASDRKVS